MLIRLAGANGNHSHAEVRRIAAAHVTEIRAKIADLQAMERVLSDAISKCELA